MKTKEKVYDEKVVEPIELPLQMYGKVLLMPPKKVYWWSDKIYSQPQYR